MIPSRGAWLEYEIDSNDVIWVRVDRARKLPVTSLLRALGYGSDEQIRQLLGNDEKLEATMQRDGGDDGTRRTRSGNEVKSKESGLMDIYRRLRPGEVGTVDSAEKLLHATFFDPKRYDMMRVGRYKYNKKLAIAARIRGHVVDQDIIDPATGEVLIAAGERIPGRQDRPAGQEDSGRGRERHLPPFGGSRGSRHRQQLCGRGCLAERGRNRKVRHQRDGSPADSQAAA